MYDAKEIEFSCGVEMETKQFKDHIVYEIDTNDKASELGIKTASRMNKVFMPIRKAGQEHLHKAQDKTTKEHRDEENGYSYIVGSYGFSRMCK